MSSVVAFPVEAITQYGILGIVLAWFMWRNEKVMNRLVDKIQELCVALKEEKNHEFQQ